MTRPSIENLQKVIDYHFRKPELLIEAITHSSYSSESSSSRGASGAIRDNEQLEFLGDAVLGFVVSAKLADAFPECSEGKLSRAKSRLVATEHLSEVAARLGLGGYLRLGHGEEKTGGRSKSRLAVDALEALVAAIYRDGGIRSAQRFITRFILPPDLVKARSLLFTVDYKSALQEYLQAERLGAAAYSIVAESGPEHQKTFVVEVSASGWAARGKGGSKKLAEQEAARACLEMVERSLLADG
jgi:ribonuclease-3